LDGFRCSTVFVGVTSGQSLVFFRLHGVDAMRVHYHARAKIDADVAADFIEMRQLPISTGRLRLFMPETGRRHRWELITNKKLTRDSTEIFVYDTRARLF